MFPWRWCHGGLRRYRYDTGLMIFIHDFDDFLRFYDDCFTFIKKCKIFPDPIGPCSFALHWKASCAKKKKIQRQQKQLLANSGNRQQFVSNETTTSWFVCVVIHEKHSSLENSLHPENTIPHSTKCDFAVSSSRRSHSGTMRPAQSWENLGKLTWHLSCELWYPHRFCLVHFKTCACVVSE